MRRLRLTLLAAAAALGPVACGKAESAETGELAPAVVGPENLALALDTVLADPAPVFRPQEGEPSYAEKITSDDRLLDLSRPAEELVRVVRALSPHIGARAELEGRRVTVWRARVGEDGGFEPIEVQPEGGRRMEVAAWRRGLR